MFEPFDYDEAETKVMPTAFDEVSTASALPPRREQSKRMESFAWWVSERTNMFLSPLNGLNRTFGEYSKNSIQHAPLDYLAEAFRLVNIGSDMRVAGYCGFELSSQSLSNSAHIRSDTAALLARQISRARAFRDEQCEPWAAVARSGLAC